MTKESPDELTVASQKLTDDEFNQIVELAAMEGAWVNMQHMSNGKGHTFGEAAQVVQEKLLSYRSDGGLGLLYNSWHYDGANGQEG